MDDITTQKPFACKATGCGMSFTNEDHLTVHEKKHEMILNLGLGPKSGNIFVADQTPTPTRLIKNCEEVGLFDDLRHVNPFDETFRRAVEQKNQNCLTSELQNEINSLSHDSLHTPQVFPNIESTDNGISSCQQIQIIPAKTASPPVTLPTEPEIIQPVRTHKILPMILPKQSTNPQLQSTIQLIQPQVITLNFPTPVINTIPVQTVKPFILPKTNVGESSASTTPTSALPIKERLKAILNSNLKAKRASQDTIFGPSVKKKQEKPKQPFDDDCMERRRAAALRYRNKIKKEHVDLRKKNAELAAENMQLKELIKQLKQDLAKHQNGLVTGNQVNNALVVNGAPEIQIPPSTVRLVMNIPKLVIQPSGQPMMKNPVTFSVEKN